MGFDQRYKYDDPIEAAQSPMRVMDIPKSGDIRDWRAVALQGACGWFIVACV